VTPTPKVEPKMVAAIEFIRRTGARRVQIRFHDDEEPTVWMVVASYDGDRHEVDASLDPTRAALRLCERLADGGECVHCHRPTGLEPDSLDRMPMDRAICWYQWDPELEKFRRGCE
jgi:hypothetical protein